MKLKNILYRNYNSLTNDEKEFYSENMGIEFTIQDTSELQEAN